MVIDHDLYRKQCAVFTPLGGFNNFWMMFLHLGSMFLEFFLIKVYINIHYGQGTKLFLGISKGIASALIGVQNPAVITDLKNTD